MRYRNSLGELFFSEVSFGYCCVRSSGHSSSGSNRASLIPFPLKLNFGLSALRFGAESLPFLPTLFPINRPTDLHNGGVVTNSKRGCGTLINTKPLAARLRSVASIQREPSGQAFLKLVDFKSKYGPLTCFAVNKK